MLGSGPVRYDGNYVTDDFIRYGTHEKETHPFSRHLEPARGLTSAVRGLRGMEKRLEFNRQEMSSSRGDISPHMLGSGPVRYDGLCC